MPRRSLSIHEDNHKRLLEFRGKLMIQGIDADYTNVLNLIIGAGVEIMDIFLKRGGQPEFWENLRQAIENPDAKRIGLQDQIEDLYAKKGMGLLKKKN